MRRSSRERSKPEDIYGAALTEAAKAATKTKKKAQQQQQQQQEEDSSDESEVEQHQEETGAAASDDSDVSEDVLAARKKKKGKGKSKGGGAMKKKASQPAVKPKPKGAAAGKGKKLKKKPAVPDTTDDEDDSADEGLDRLMSEGGGGGRKGKGGVQKKKRGGGGMANLKEGKHSLLFESLVRDLPVEKRMRDWVQAYEEEEAKKEEDEEEMGGTSLVDMFNFLVWSAGASKSYVDREAEVLPDMDSEEWEVLVEGVVEDLREGSAQYPLLEGGKRFKGFRARFADGWEQLVKAARDGNGHKLEPLRSVIDLVHALCEVSLVSVRHTAAYAGMRLGNALVKETLALSKKTEVASRQLDAEQRKGAGRSRKALDLNKSIEELAAHTTALEGVLEEIFNGVFASRYRDVNERVRADCMEGLGFFVETYPSMFLRDQFVKYLGWMLYDKAAAVRASAAHVLLRLYSKADFLPQLENFTARFLARLEDLVHDVDEGVKRTAIQILRCLQGAGYLDEASHELLDEVDELLLDPTWDVRTREQAMLFFTDHVEGFNDLSDDEEEAGAGEEEDQDQDQEEGAAGGKTKGKKRKKATASTKKKAARGGGGQGEVRRRGVMKRLVKVVQFLDYHLGEGEEWKPEFEQLVASCVEAFERHPEGDFLYDWSTYFQLLREGSAVARLSDHEQSLLIRLLGASVKRAASHAELGAEGGAIAGGGKKGSTGTGGGGLSGAALRAAKQKLEAALEAFTSGAVEDLPKVLSQFQTDAAKMAGLVALPQYLQGDTIENKRNKGHFEALLKLLKDLYLKATQAPVLTDVARSLAHLLQQDEEAGSRLHNVGAVLQTILEELRKRLAASLEKKGDKENAGKRGSSRSKGKGKENEEDADFAAGLVLLQLGTLAKQVDLSDYLGNREEGELEALAAEVQEVVMSRLGNGTWSGDEERLGLTTRVVREGMYLLYVLLLHSTRGLIRLAVQKKPPKKDEEAEEGDDAVGEEEAQIVVAQRTTLLEVLSAVLGMDADVMDAEGGDAMEEEDEDEKEDAEADDEGNPTQKKQKQKRRGTVAGGKLSPAVVAAVEEVKKAAYALASDLRFVFRPQCKVYEVLHRVVWVPEPDFLRLLQTFFQKEEARYEEAVAVAEEQGDDEALAEADEVLRRDLLDPLIRSVLYTTENINRRQASAIAAHFVDSGKQSMESVKFLMKQLKDLDMKMYLEVQMTTLRSCYHKWCRLPVEEGQGGEEEDARASAGLEKIQRLAIRMAQTMGVGRLRAHTDAQVQAVDSFVRFLKSGVAFALEDAPKNLTFLDALRHYVGKLPEDRLRDVAQLLSEKTAALPEHIKELVEKEREVVVAAEKDGEEPPEHLTTEEGLAYLHFYYDLHGRYTVGGSNGGAKRQSATPSKAKRGSSGAGTSSSAKKRRSSSGGGGKGKKKAAAEEEEEEMGPGDDEEDSIHSSENEESAHRQPARSTKASAATSKKQQQQQQQQQRRSSSVLASVHEADEDIEEEDDDSEADSDDSESETRLPKQKKKQQKQQQRRSSQQSQPLNKKRGRHSSQAAAAEEEAEVEGRYNSDSETSIFGELMLAEGGGGEGAAKGSKKQRK